MRRSISMIFQGFNLLEQRSVLRNVCFPLEMSGTKSGEAKKRALELLKLVGLESKANAYPAQLSGGQKQRVAIASACDEPALPPVRRGHKRVSTRTPPARYLSCCVR